MADRPQQPALSVAEFLQLLRDSELFSGEEFVRHSAACTHMPDAAAAIKSLVDDQALTQYQADAVAGGHFEQLRMGNYDILSKLGAGGMGAVFKARHRRMKRIVAVKLLSSEIARQDSFVQRFQREVETIAQLTHPNIVMAYDADECEAGHFLVMEYVDGRDLASEVQKFGPLSAAAAVDYIAQAAAGLEVAHSKTIVHRDIKPANLMLTTDGVVKVADLGLARLTGGAANEAAGSFSLTQAGGILGTADYMPPEQALDSTMIDQRADVYSLGCTLYYLLAGKPPYYATSLLALMLAHRDGKIPDLRTVRPEVPLALVSAFERMVAKRPEDRPASMADIIRLMEAIKPLVKELTARPVASQMGSQEQSATVCADATSLAASNILTPRGDVPSPSEANRLAELVIVLVEPSRTQNTIFRSYLTNLGLTQVHSTGSGAQALVLAKQEQANAIICTMHLSDMTGLQLAAMLRDDPRFSGIGFVLMSSETDNTEASIVVAGPRRVLLVKPFDLKQLAQAIATATGRTTETLSAHA